MNNKYVYTCFLDDENIEYDTKQEAVNALINKCDEDSNIFNEWLDESVNASTVLEMISTNGYEATFDTLFSRMITEYSKINIYKIDKLTKQIVED